MDKYNLFNADALESTDDGAVADLVRPFVDAGALAERMAWAKGLKDDSARTVQSALQRTQSLGVQRRVARPPSLEGLIAIERDFPHCAHLIDFVRKRVVLGSLVADCPMQLPPILLSGPPGTGKTALSQRLAGWLGVPLVNIDMATVDASFKLTGLDPGFSTGRPGMVWDALDQACMSPVLVLDELDKQPRGGWQEGSSWLLGLLEPVSARRYCDNCLGLAVDASYISWIATCNDLGAIDAPLLSRFRVFEMEQPTQPQMRAVALSVWREMRSMHAWTAAFEPDLQESVLDALTQYTPRELRQLLEDAFANAALQGRRRLRIEDLSNGNHRGRRRVFGFLE